MTVREIQGFLAEMYAVEVSPDLISTVTESMVAEVTAWQALAVLPAGSRDILGSAYAASLLEVTSVTSAR